MPSLILNLLIFWFIGRLLAGRLSQRPRQETAGETVARTKRRPPKRVRRGLTGPSYQIEAEEIETATAEVPAQEADTASFPGAEPEQQPPQTAVVATASPEYITPETATTTQEEPLERTVSPSPDSLLAPGTLVQSLILMQALSEPRCKRAWRTNHFLSHR